MMRRAALLAAVGAVISWLLDGALARLRGGPEPIRTLAVVEAPIERVWAELIDVEGQPRWMHDLKSVHFDESGRSIRVGSRAVGTVRMFGIAVSDPVTVTALEPPTRFGISHDGLFAGSGVFRLEPGADGTTTIVRWDELLVAPILPGLVGVLTRPLFRAVFQADLRRFRELVEGAPGA